MVKKTTKKKSTKKKTSKEEDVKSKTPQDERKEESKEKTAEKVKDEKKEVKQKKKKTTKTRKKKSKKNPAVVARGKRKTAIARASVRPGKGNLRINKSSINSVNNRYVKDLILEPVKLAGERALKVDIYVSVSGGGSLGQAQAARTAIAKGLVEYFDDDSLKSIYMDRDRSLLVEDSRRVESKKFKGPKARARFQKSYR